MAKPTDLPVHATDANYPMDAAPEQGTPTKVEPLSGKQALGHRPAEKPPAQSENWWKNLVYLWLLWLNGIVAGAVNRIVQIGADGELYASEDMTIDDLTVTGDAQINGALNVTGDSGFNKMRSRALHPAQGAYTVLGTGYILGFTNGDDLTGLVPAGSGVWEATAGSSACRQHMSLDQGSKFYKVKVRWEKTSGGDDTFEINLYNSTTGTHSNIDSFSPAGQIVGNNTAELWLLDAFTFADKTYTANSTTDTLAITAHGLLTGDGPVQIETTGTEPAGLTISTNYYVIKVDANTIQLAATRDAALARTAETFTDNGTGVQTLVDVGSLTAHVDPLELGENEDITVSFNAVADGDRLRMIQPYWTRPVTVSV